jgi:hypothetical protein
MIKKLRALFFGALCLLSQFSNAQIIDNFSDGDFTNNPSWIGFTDSFTVSSGQLRSTIGNASSLNFYLATASTETFNSWEFFFRLNFNPSSQNFAEFWLSTDILNIEQAQNGFFVRMGGNTGDGIGLFKKENGTVSEIIPQANTLVNGTSNNQGKIKVTRSSTGNWEIFEQITSANFISFGTGTDNSNFVSSGIGVWIKSTKSNRNKHYFDDIKVENTNAVDITPPTLSSATLVAPNQVELQFSEPIDETFASTNSLFSISPTLSLASSGRVPGDFTKVRLTFSANLPSGTNTITVIQAKDLAGNIQNSPQVKTVVVEVQATARSLVINEIYADETPSNGLPLVEFIEIFNATSNPIQLGGDSLQVGNTKVLLPSYLLNSNAFVILCRADSVSKFSGFGPALGISLPALTNTGSTISIKDNNGNILDQVTYALSWYNSTSKQNGGWSLEQINPNLKCSGKFNWSASNAGIGGTPGTQNSIFSGIADTQAPVLDSLIIVNANQIRLVFNEILNAELVSASNFSIPGLTIATVFSNQPNNKSILINLSTAIQSGVTYTLTYSGIKDCEGNNISTPLNKDFIFVQPVPIGPRALVINEIYADETPSLGLPLVEFVELFNSTNQPIQLLGVKLSVATSNVTLPAYVLNANAYITLCKTDSVAKFSSFGPALGIAIPVIVNSGSTIRLTNANDSEIDAVTFTTTWYNSTSKQNGGWSLEQINPNLKCSGKFNWSASNAGIGGTPGTQNSIFSGIADTQAPVLDSIIVVNVNQIRLVFNEILNAEVVPASSFSIPGLIISSVLSNQPNNKSILVNLSTAIQSGVTYTLTYSGIKDCEGNNISTSLNKDFLYLLPGSLSSRALVINEIYADETPSLGLPLVEYIEIMNTTNQAIQLGGDSIFIGTRKLRLPSYVLNANAYLILCRSDSVGKFSNFGPTLGISIPGDAITNGGTNLIIKDINGNEIDAVTFSQSWYNSTSKQNGGWSLEQINPNLKCSGKFNWSASNAGIGGTPGTQNSIFSGIADTQAPVLDSIIVVNVNQIRLVFNEILNAEVVPASSFSIPGLTISSVLSNQPNNKSILVNLSTAIQSGVTYTLTYSGIKDCEGNIGNQPLTRNFVFVPQAPIPSRALVINEIYADETPSLGLPKVEYLEIYNTTNQPIQLKGAGILVGDNGYTFPDYVINGDSYAIICKPDSAIKFANFGSTIGLPISPLTNGGTRISIQDFEDNEVDAVDYKLSWYRSPAKQNGGFSLEQINPKLKCSGRFNWSASDAGIGGTPGAQNSIFSPIPDNQPPKLDSIVVVKSNEIRLVFSEFINEESLPFSNFSIPGLNIIQVKTRNPNERSIVITFVNDIEVGQYCNLTWTGVRDCEGNNNPQSFTQRFIRLPAKDLLPRNLVINEIYADETPSLGLPSVEYLEIYNTTDNPIQLKGATLDVNGTTVVFPEFVLDGKSYTVVCETDSAYRFKDFGQVVGLSLPTLSNDGAEVKLIDIAGNEIDVVNYAISWYGTSSKQNGGFSLEQINPNLPCSGKSNWLASNAGIGGTPGAVNSINSDKQDTDAPSLVKVEVAGPNKLLLIFSEPLNALAPDSNSFKIPGLNIAFIGNRNPDQVSIILTFATPFELGRKYNLTLSNIKDCAGNIMTERILSIGKGKKPGKFDLLITEVQADDTPENTLPKAEYIELFNNTDQLLDLTGVRLMDESGEGELPQSFLGPKEFMVLTSTSGLLKFEGVSNINVLGLSPFITLNSEGDKLTLFNSDGLWLHQLHFNSSDYAEYSKWSQGWSLEMIDFSNPCDELNNWSISTSTVGGTPGMENSVKAVKPDLNAPILVRATVPDSNMIKLKWNELLDSTTMANASISISNGFQVVDRFISSSDFTVLYIKADKNLIVNEPVTVTIGILNDCAGNATNSTTISTVRTGKADASSWILNEILFDPKTGGSDYVEIKNVSNQYLDLKEVILATDSEEEQVSLETIPIAPGGFALFTDSKALTLRDYPKGKSENFYEIGMPSFNSDSGTVRILGPGKQEWQKFFFSDKIHAQILDETKGVSLERISNLLPVNNSNSWQSASSDADYGTPGYENSQTANIAESNSAFFVDHKAFSPNGDGNTDFVTFNYNLDLAGLLGTLRIYSAEGLLVKNIAQTALLGKDGFWKWDGTTEQGRKARIGVYVAVLETVELGGDSKYYKIPVAIASEK